MIYGSLFGDLFSLDWNEPRTLEHDGEDGTHIIFNKYEFDFFFGRIRHKKTKEYLSYGVGDDYNSIGPLDDSGNRRIIRVARAVLSTFVGKPKENDTADHLDCTNKNFDSIISLTWMDKDGQSRNQIRPDTCADAFLISGPLPNSNKKHTATSKEWEKIYAGILNRNGNVLKRTSFSDYARRNVKGFSYKIFNDIPGEIWKTVVNSKNSRFHLEVSNKCRIARVSKYTRNVLSGDRLGLDRDRPITAVNGNDCHIHILVFAAFYPELYESKETGQVVRHLNDVSMDFRPENLVLGTRPENGTEAHDNGCHSGSSKERQACASFINDKFEKRHISQRDAADYLKANGYPNASNTAISRAIRAFKNNDKILIIYERTWKPSN
jgi:hypothetical protein